MFQQLQFDGARITSWRNPFRTLIVEILEAWNILELSQGHFLPRRCEHLQPKHHEWRNSFEPSHKLKFIPT